MSKLDRLQRLDLLNQEPGPIKTPRVEAPLDDEEVTYEWPEGIKTRWLESFEAIAWNGSMDGERDLKRTLGARANLASDWVSLGSGVDDVLRNVLLAWGLRSTLVYPVPTRSVYGKLAVSLGIKHVAVQLRADFTICVEQVIATVNNLGASIVLICNPNNPTGNLFARDELLAIAQGVNALVVIDESQIAFSGGSLDDALPEAENLAIVRNIPNLGPFRVGYLLAAPRVIAEVEKVRLPRIPEPPAVLAAQCVLNGDGCGPDFAEVVLERERLRNALCGIPGVVSWPSSGNFILIGTTLDGTTLRSRLLARGVAVCSFDRSPLKNCVRATVGPAAMNQRLINALGEVLDEAETGLGFETRAE